MKGLIGFVIFPGFTAAAAAGFSAPAVTRGPAHADRLTAWAAPRICLMCQSLKGADSLVLKAAILFLLFLFEQSDDSHCHIEAAAAEDGDSAVIDAPAHAVVTVGCVGRLLLSPPTTQSPFRNAAEKLRNLSST